MANKILVNSGIYSILNLLQKGINFLLVPILTSYLTTYDYGVVAVVTAVSAFLNVFYLLSLNGCLNRFYYEYKDDVEKVKKLFGTIVTFVFLFSFLLTIVLFLGHKYLIDPFLDNVSFFPFMLIGMISILFNPVYTIFQNTLQARQEGKRFGKNNLMFFTTNLCFLLISVTLLNLGAKGVLGSLALTNIIFFIYTISRFGKDITIGIDISILRESIKYSLPLVPHSLSGVVTTIIDRLFINNMLSTSLTGIYHLGNTFGGVVFLLASGVNQAFVPWFNEQAKLQKYNGIPRIAKVLVFLYCIIALGLSFFGKNIIFIITPEVYHQGWKVIPYISFAFVFHSVYYFFSTPLFYNIEKKGSRVLPFFTIFSAIVNIILNYFLIKEYGFLGAAIATLITKFVLVTSLSRVYKKFVKIDYSSIIMLLVPWLYFIISLIVFYDFETSEIMVKILIYSLVLIVTFFYLKKDILNLLKKDLV
ncbi:hypothetical protein BW723_03010 [Polaribacter reichenbachii]|uniref:Uncharacterized protein n=1 Tax=Polaribacter reichenbachii TaxID=996801 RepID=A0A1B8TVM9_9FLAO|nr:oligosaccharide flippase family protein [Polaribacter reichenbachii]APZ45331.1 hypothetical protein BW723_03010 [Polaribacter reichenbachii]AUC19193.1 hypothetical protein BTO17_11015 [Polaribacter reichenbachii]OBY63650.1 hypothetical protein LPB301_12690 [Polaribacter reichenbachii]